MEEEVAEAEAGAETETEAEAEAEVEADAEAEARTETEAGAVDSGVLDETVHAIPNTVADHEHGLGLTDLDASDDLSQLMEDMGDMLGPTASQALPEIFFGPDDGRLYWDKPTEYDRSRSPSPQTPREWPASPARPVRFNSS